MCCKKKKSKGVYKNVVAHYRTTERTNMALSVKREHKKNITCEAGEPDNPKRHKGLANSTYLHRGKPLANILIFPYELLELILRRSGCRVSPLMSTCTEFREIFLALLSKQVDDWRYLFKNRLQGIPASVNVCQNFMAIIRLTRLVPNIVSETGMLLQQYYWWCCEEQLAVEHRNSAPPGDRLACIFQLLWAAYTIRNRFVTALRKCAESVWTVTVELMDQVKKAVSDTMVVKCESANFVPSKNHAGQSTFSVIEGSSPSMIVWFRFREQEHVLRMSFEDVRFDLLHFAEFLALVTGFVQRETLTQEML